MSKFLEDKMKISFMKYFVAVFLLLIIKSTAIAQQHPNLVINREDVKEIKENLGKVPLFDKVFDKAKQTIDEAIREPIDVPVPKDPAGGYTHTKHQENYKEMYLAGIMYSVTGEKKYAGFIRDMLDKYAAMYPTLPLHPAAKGEAPGKLFWQSLNETVWLFYTIQAYDCIYDWLTPEERKNYEDNIFRPMCKFFVVNTRQQFDFIHNHGTWMDASVGMTGYVLKDKKLVQQALYGSKIDSTAGYMKQLQMLISPDGYYTEGAYYARYALMPFFLFAKAIQNNQPDMKIFDYRNQILKKFLYASLQMTYTNGNFIPINDALKEKNFLSVEIVDALDITYKEYGHDNSLLSIAKRQGTVMLDGAGLLVAKALKDPSNVKEFQWKSEDFSDGPNGKSGGLDILRYGPSSDEECLVFKYTSHGLSHGHFDKLSCLFYDAGKEILQDYGSARFLNIEQKDGGRYLFENKTFAKQTIAHNTIVVDEKSDYDGKMDISEKYHPDKFYFSDKNPDFQVTSAVDTHSYKGVRMHRTLAMINDKSFSRPIIVDIFSVESDKEHQYDLPFYYMGQFISTNFKYNAFSTNLSPLGKKNGYQYLWKEAVGSMNGTAKFTWLNDERFYSIVSSVDSTDELYMLRIGANDPNFNLRNDPAYMIRAKGKDHVFASVLEPHGDFNPKDEQTVNSYSQVKSIKVLASNSEATVTEVEMNNGLLLNLMVANNSSDKTGGHSIDINGKMYKWKGAVYLLKTNLK